MALSVITRARPWGVRGRSSTPHHPNRCLHNKIRWCGGHRSTVAAAVLGRNPQLLCATSNSSRCAADKPAAMARRAVLLQIPPERPPTAAETRCAAREQPLVQLWTCEVTKSKSLCWTCNRRVGRKLHDTRVADCILWYECFGFRNRSRPVNNIWGGGCPPLTPRTYVLLLLKPLVTDLFDPVNMYLASILHAHVQHFTLPRPEDAGTWRRSVHTASARCAAPPRAATRLQRSGSWA
jgi:hypothetical protein